MHMLQRHAPKPEMKRGPASSSQPTSHSIQLHALQTELAAAEANVMELKRLIAELESQGENDAVLQCDCRSSIPSYTVVQMYADFCTYKPCSLYTAAWHDVHGTITGRQIATSLVQTGSVLAIRIAVRD